MVRLLKQNYTCESDGKITKQIFTCESDNETLCKWSICYWKCRSKMPIWHELLSTNFYALWTFLHFASLQNLNTWSLKLKPLFLPFDREWYIILHSSKVCFQRNLNHHTTQNYRHWRCVSLFLYLWARAASMIIFHQPPKTF